MRCGCHKKSFDCNLSRRKKLYYINGNVRRENLELAFSIHIAFLKIYLCEYLLHQLYIWEFHGSYTIKKNAFSLKNKITHKKKHFRPSIFWTQWTWQEDVCEHMLQSSVRLCLECLREYTKYTERTKYIKHTEYTKHTNYTKYK